MRTKFMLRNLLVSVTGQMITLLLTFVSRILFVRYLSAAYLGVNGLFSDLLGVLTLSELGIGTAMLYSLYKPAAEENKVQLAHLMRLYRRMYHIVAAVVLLLGLLLLPFLPWLVRDSGDVAQLPLIYLLYLLSTACSYLLSYHNSIYVAHQKAYVRAVWCQVFDILRVAVQILILIFTQNFYLYLLAQLVLPFCPNLIIARKVRKDYPYLADIPGLPDKAERRTIFRDVGAMSIHRFSTAVVRNTDNLLMSAFIGLNTVGIYANYRMLLGSLNGLMAKLLGAFSGGIGNLNATESPARVYAVYQELDLMLYLLYAYLTGGLFLFLTPLLRLMFGAEYCFSLGTLTVIVLEFYLSGMRQMNLLFREARGLFRYDRWKAIAEAVLNLIFSLALVKPFGVAGVLGGTVLSSLLTCVWVEPMILMRHGIGEGWREKLRLYFLCYGTRLVLVMLLCALGYKLLTPLATNIPGLLLGCAVYSIVFAGVMYGCFRRSEAFGQLAQRVRHLFHSLFA